MLPNNSFLFFLIAAFVFTSCDPNRVFDDYQSVPNTWNKEHVISFKVNPVDSVKPLDLFVNIRNTNEYKFSNLFLIVEMINPNGKIQKDTLEYKMAEPSGKLLGTGYTDIKENKLWYKEGFVFNETGDYTINIQQAMRENGKVNGVKNLDGITDVGFRIENPTNIKP
ncbi:gliding motility lipoprotein GldH [Algibacter miyuki]|uniref:Gliding motility lipoprotein GldH n=1 Tax=Algibacter miyuki TaxID=1306933 RepID=A0ABV5GVV5_9FLAO|nr:gliding motility lipoprotein GldH [Algibacter miyuki]MDN3665094.1 gliding motility lipoprotein GldH [Algibacter miyuki]